MTHELWVKHSLAEQFHEIPLNSFIVFTNQPQKNNVLSLFEKQVYPHRLLPNGDAEAPYDVAGWTLPLQMGVETYPVAEIRDLDKYSATVKRMNSTNDVRAALNLPKAAAPMPKLSNPLRTAPRVGLYKPFTSSMDEGWTRFVFDDNQIPFKSVSNSDIRNGDLPFDTLVFAADSENSIVNGLSANRYPAEFAGGIGDAGVENLKKFVRNGGRIVCLDDSCAMMIKRFDLPIKNVVNGLRRNAFYNPGSIVKIIVDTTDPIGRGLNEETPAYFSSSSAFEFTSNSGVRSIARYADKDVLLSGWMLGEKYIAGRSAIAEAKYGKGSIVLFAFRLQHRAQSAATFPLLFNALEKSSER